jgi:hypothetical protein
VRTAAAATSLGTIIGTGKLTAQHVEWFFAFQTVAPFTKQLGFAAPLSL